MKKITLSILLLAFSNFLLIAQNKEVIDKMIEEVNYLASDKLEGRETGTASEKLAAKYIRDKFKEYNVLSKGTDGYFQYFEATINSQPHSDVVEKKISGINVIGYLDNTQKETVIIGAHYDHLGWGGEGSLYRGEPAIHNGADDNASGTAGILELARIYSKSKYDNYNYLFIAFSGEEKGLLGSNAFAKSDLLNPDKINYMVNMDMIGRLNEEGRIAIYGTGTSPRWNSLLEENRCKNITINTTKSGVGPSDHTSFYLQDIPVLHFFTGAHEDYHKPSDDADKVNYEGIATVLIYMQNLINDLDDEKKLVFTKTKSDENQKAPKFSVTLGVIPDYLYSETGMRIDGVSDGKPAHNAGMQKGDIVVQLGDVKVVDMITYMKALGRYVRGDTVKATVIRDGKAIELAVSF